jgi:ABC-type lipoprotein export system ATPase subunit
MGHPIHALPAKERAALQKRHIGFVFQSYHLLDNLTVYENIELPLSYRDVQQVRAPGHRRQRARSLRHRREEGSLSQSSSRAASSSS